MDGAGRIFAGEYCRARNVRADFAGENPSPLTPGGMVCNLLFIAGTLTEKGQHSGDYLYGRVADPTGVFQVRKMRPDAGLKEVIAGIDIPAFVTVLGQARATAHSADPAPYIELLEIQGGRSHGQGYLDSKDRRTHLQPAHSSEGGTAIRHREPRIRTCDTGVPDRQRSYRTTGRHGMQGPCTGRRSITPGRTSCGNQGKSALNYQGICREERIASR